MEFMSDQDLDSFCAAVCLARYKQNGVTVGNQISFGHAPQRSISVWSGPPEATSYLSALFKTIVSADYSWVLIPKWGLASGLSFDCPFSDAAAIQFPKSELDELVCFLISRDQRIGAVSSDLYIVSHTGNIILAVDHHSTEEGFRIECRDISEASRMLQELNTIGAEMEVYFSNS